MVASLRSARIMGRMLLESFQYVVVLFWLFRLLGVGPLYPGAYKMVKQTQDNYRQHLFCDRSCTPNVLLATFGMFLLFTCIHSSTAPSWISSLSKMSYGMYLMHMFFLSQIAPLVIGGDVANPILPVWLAIPSIAILTYLCAALTTRLLSLLPGSKYVVGC